MIVVKFGGSSVRDASAFRRCLEIIKSDDAIKLVILSATYNTTNELEDIFSLSLSSSVKNNTLKQQSFQSLVSRHKSLAKELCLEDRVVADFFNDVEKKFHKCVRKDDYLALGELVSSTLFYLFLRDSLESSVKLVDARTLIKTDSEYGKAKPDEAAIKLACKKLDTQNNLIITQGFIGSDDRGHTTTLGREGSDYSASLLAAALEADEVQIWTDVDGIYSADPRLVKEAIPIKKLSYEQAAKLAQSGAKVLFSKTLAPVVVKKIPVRVKSSLDPEKEGSIITDERALRCAVTSQKSNNDQNHFVITIVGPHLDHKNFSQQVVTSDNHLELLNSLHKKFCL